MTLTIPVIYHHYPLISLRVTFCADIVNYHIQMDLLMTWAGNYDYSTNHFRPIDANDGHRALLHASLSIAKLKLNFKNIFLEIPLSFKTVLL